MEPELPPTLDLPDVRAGQPDTEPGAESTVRVTVTSLAGAPPADLPPSASLPLLPGYAVHELVGRGGCGRVYRATHLALGRDVAVKLLTGEPSERELTRFRDESRAVASVSHPNVSQVFDSGSADGRPFYAQEFLPGGTLAEKLRANPLSPADAAAVVEAVARAVGFCHDRGIVHRDLKPHNVLFAADGTPKVTDFGLAKRLDAGDGVTRAGEILGTPAYMPPEQAAGAAGTVGPEADVYALGAILYDCLTGRPPFAGPDVLQTLTMVMTLDPVPPRDLQPSVPRDLETICLKCLQKPIARRYPSAVTLADDLQRFRAGEPIHARPVGLAERAVKWAKRRKAAAALVGMSVVCAAVVAGTAVRLAVLGAELRTANEQLTRTNGELAATNVKLERQTHETNAAYDQALNDLDRYSFGLGSRLKDLPRSDRLRTELLADAAASLANLERVWPGDPRIQNYRLTGYDRLGGAYLQAGRLDDAEAAFRRALAINDELLAAAPDSRALLPNRPILELNLARIAAERGKADEAAKLRAAAAGHAAALPADQPETARGTELRYLLGMAAAHDALAAKKPADAVAGLRDAVAAAEVLAEKDPKNPQRMYDLVQARSALGGLLAHLNRTDDAAAVFAQATRDLEHVADPDGLSARRTRASLRGQLGVLYDRLKRPADVEKEYLASAAEYESLAADYPQQPAFQFQAALAWQSLALLKLTPAELPAAKDRYLKARQHFAALAKKHPDQPHFADFLSTVEKSLTTIDAQLKK